MQSNTHVGAMIPTYWNVRCIHLFLQGQDKMAFVIVRPGGLTDDPASGNGVLTESTSVAGSISRDDVAALVVKALLSKKTDGKVGGCARLALRYAPCIPENLVNEFWAPSVSTSSTASQKKGCLSLLTYSVIIVRYILCLRSRIFFCGAGKLVEQSNYLAEGQPYVT